MKTELEITYIFIRYATTTLQRQATIFYKKQGKIFTHEPYELIESTGIEKALQYQSDKRLITPVETLEKKFMSKELYANFSLLTTEEQFILMEKHCQNSSDAKIGKQLHISSQMVSRKKRHAYAKLKKLLADI